MDSMDSIGTCNRRVSLTEFKNFKHIRLPQVTTPQTVYREVPPKMPTGDKSPKRWDGRMSF